MGETRHVSSSIPGSVCEDRGCPVCLSVSTSPCPTHQGLQQTSVAGRGEAGGSLHAAVPNSMPAAASRPGLEVSPGHSGAASGLEPVKRPQREVTTFTARHGQGVSDSP